MAGDINFTWNRDTWRPWECRNANNRHLIAKKKKKKLCALDLILQAQICVCYKVHYKSAADIICLVIMIYVIATKI